MKKIKSLLSLILRISVSGILLVLLFKLNHIDLRGLLNDVKGANKLFLSLGFLVFLLTYFLGFLRWQMLLKAAGINASAKKLITSFSGGIFFSIFLPSTIGGDIVRTADLAEHTKKAKEVIATVFLDRLSGYIGLVIVIIPAFLLGGQLVQDKFVFLSLAAIVGLLLLVLLVLFNSFIYSRISSFLSAPGAGRIKDKLKSLHHEIHIFRHRKKLILHNLILSFFIQLIYPLSVYFIGLALGIRVNLIYYLIFLPIIGAVTLLPIAIGGLGLREYLFVIYFAKAAVAKQLAVAMSLLSFSFIVLYGAIGGLIYVLTVHHRRLQHH